MENETKKYVVIAKAQKFFKIGVPIMGAALIILFTVLMIFITEARVLLPIMLVFVAMLVLALANPINAICYDEEKQEFIVRGGQTFFTTFKRRYVNLSEIERVVGYPTNMWFPSSHEGLFIFIKNNAKPMSIRTISRPEKAAEKINMLLMQAAIMQEIARKNAQTENNGAN